MSKAAFNARNDTYDKRAYCIDSFIEVTEILYRTEQLICEAWSTNTRTGTLHLLPYPLYFPTIIVLI